MPRQKTVSFGERLSYISAAHGRRDDALALLAEASSIAAASGAHAITRQVEEARTQL